MDDDTTDAALHQVELEQRQRQEAEGWQWWTSYHKALCERRKAERATYEETARMVREWIDAQ